MSCGSKYASLLVTEDGKTPDDPYNVFPGPTDYDEWYDVTRKVEKEVYRKWRFMVAIEKRLSEMDLPDGVEGYPERDRLLQMLIEFGNDMKDVRHVLIESVNGFDFTWGESVDKAIAVGQEGTCLMEEIDEATKYYKETPIPTIQPARKPGSGKFDVQDDEDKKEDDSSGFLVGLMALGMIGGGAWLWRKHSARNAEDEDAKAKAKTKTWPKPKAKTKEDPR